MMRDGLPDLEPIVAYKRIERYRYIPLVTVIGYSVTALLPMSRRLGC